MKLSIVSAVYKAERIVDELVLRTTKAVSALTDDYEIILVEDGSHDDSWEKIQQNCNTNPKVRGVKLSRNFGQHYAVTAGIEKATGDYVVLLDCDLQDNPEQIKTLLEHAEKGNDIVFTRRVHRKHSAMKSFNAWVYNKMFNFFSDKKYDVNLGSLVLFTRQVARVFLELKDRDRLYLQMLKWVGFQTTTVEVEHMPRYEGKSSYNFIKLLAIGLQGWTSHSTKLLRYSTYLGLTLALLSLTAAFVVLIRYFLYDFLPGWPSIIISILGSTGLILLSIGITGIYIGKTFEQVKNRPLYIIEKEINIDER